MVRRIDVRQLVSGADQRVEARASRPCSAVNFAKLPELLRRKELKL